MGAYINPHLCFFESKSVHRRGSKLDFFRRNSIICPSGLIILRRNWIISPWDLQCGVCVVNSGLQMKKWTFSVRVTQHPRRYNYKNSCWINPSFCSILMSIDKCISAPLKNFCYRTWILFSCVKSSTFSNKSSILKVKKFVYRLVPLETYIIWILVLHTQTTPRAARYDTRRTDGVDTSGVTEPRFSCPKFLRTPDA